MLRFLGYCGPKVFEIFHLPRLSQTTLVLLKKGGKKGKAGGNPPQKDQGHTDSFSYLKATQPDNEPVDPAT